MLRSLRASRNGLRRALHAVAPRPVPAASPKSAIPPPPPPSAAGEVDFEWLKNACKRLESQNERLERKLDAVQADLESFCCDEVEDQVRAAVAKEFGREYAERYTASSIVGLVAMLDKDSVEKLAGFPAGWEGAGGVIAVADRVCIRLLEEDVPRKLLQFILNGLASSVTDEESLKSISLLLDCPKELPSVDSTMEGAYEHVIRILEKEKLVSCAETVQKLWSLMQIKTRKDKVAFLRERKGPGLVCLIHMTGLCAWSEAHACLEFGVRGRMETGEVDGEGSFQVFIETGEAASVKLLKHESKQLEIRLLVLKALFTSLSPRAEVFCTGRLFTKHGSEEDKAKLEVLLREAADRGISLCLHHNMHRK